MHLVPMTHDAEEIEEFYEGFSNATIWPLYHDVVAKPEFHREWWDAYVCGQPPLRREGRRRRGQGRHGLGARLPAPAGAADAARAAAGPRIGFYLHIPFPPAELFQQLPWRRQILEGLLGADLVGFQMPGAAANFVRLVRQRVGHKTHRDLIYLPDGRTVQAAAFPISIDAGGFEELAGPSRSASAPRRSARRSATPRDPPRHRPARLHQGHLRAAARVQRADQRRRARRRGRRVRPGGGAVARAGRAVPDPARRHRPAGRPDQRRPSAGSAARRSATCTRRTRARRWRRSTAPPTSWW